MQLSPVNNIKSMKSKMKVWVNKGSINNNYGKQNMKTTQKQWNHCK